MLLLHVIAVHGRQGMALGEIAAASNLDRATARRLLLALMGAGFVSQEAGARRYHLGLQFFSLAAAAANRFDLSEARRATLSRLSRATGAAAVWLARDGDDLVCIDGVHAPGQPIGLEIGTRRPLGADTYGMALLAALSEPECASIIDRNSSLLATRPGEALRQFHERLERTRRAGHAMNYDLPWSCCCLAVAVRDRQGQAEGVVGLSAPSFRPEAVSNLVSIVSGQITAYQDAASRLPRMFSDRRGAARTRLPLFEELAISHCEIEREV